MDRAELQRALPKELWEKVRLQLDVAQAGLLAPPKQRSKYGNVRTFGLYRWWDSAKELAHAEALDMAQRAGLLDYWHTKSWWRLEGGWYELDFEEKWKGEEKPRFVDVKGGKGTVTKLYRLKKRAIFDRYGVELQEV
jgi:hypothetical protein